MAVAGDQHGHCAAGVIYQRRAHDGRDCSRTTAAPRRHRPLRSSARRVSGRCSDPVPSVSSDRLPRAPSFARRRERRRSQGRHAGGSAGRGVRRHGASRGRKSTGAHAHPGSSSRPRARSRIAGHNVMSADRGELRELRRRSVSMVFQHPRAPRTSARDRQRRVRPRGPGHGQAGATRGRADPSGWSASTTSRTSSPTSSRAACSSASASRERSQRIPR